jgi:hypothetical protein
MWVANGASNDGGVMVGARDALAVSISSFCVLYALSSGMWCEVSKNCQTSRGIADWISGVAETERWWWNFGQQRWFDPSRKE